MQPEENLANTRLEAIKKEIKDLNDYNKSSRLFFRQELKGLAKEITRLHEESAKYGTQSESSNVSIPAPIEHPSPKSSSLRVDLLNKILSSTVRKSSAPSAPEPENPATTDVLPPSATNPATILRAKNEVMKAVEDHIDQLTQNTFTVYQKLNEAASKATTPEERETILKLLEEQKININKNLAIINKLGFALVGANNLILLRDAYQTLQKMEKSTIDQAIHLFDTNHPGERNLKEKINNLQREIENLQQSLFEDRNPQKGLSQNEREYKQKSIDNLVQMINDKDRFLEIYKLQLQIRQYENSTTPQETKALHDKLINQKQSLQGEKAFLPQNKDNDRIRKEMTQRIEMIEKAIEDKERPNKERPNVAWRPAQVSNAPTPKS